MASVDVVIPCYQYGHFLRDCVRSVLDQDIECLRLLIIDNASTDDSLEIAWEIADADSRVEVSSHPRNLGPLTSINEGIDWARADYFLVLCADDLLAPGALRHAASIMDRHPEVVLTYGAAEVIGEESALTVHQQPTDVQWQVVSGRVLLERLLRTVYCHVPGPTAVVRTSAQKQVGYYRHELPHSCDLEMWMRLACAGSIAETNRSQGFVRRHATNRSSLITDLAWYLHFDAAVESFFANEGATAREAKGLYGFARRSLGERAYWSAIANLFRGRNRLGMELFRFAFAHRPTAILLPPVLSLLRRDDALRRMSGVISDTVGRLRSSDARPASLGK
jgi:glycosyltransferase involved in cell wall biosynthesis